MPILPPDMAQQCKLELLGTRKQMWLHNWDPLWSCLWPVPLTDSVLITVSVGAKQKNAWQPSYGCSECSWNRWPLLWRLLPQMGSAHLQLHTTGTYDSLTIYTAWWQFSDVVASFVVRTKLLNIEPGYYWDGWLAWYITKPTRSTQACIPPGLLNRAPALTGWGKCGNVTSARWQVTLCDPIWHVSSSSGAVLVAQTAILFLTNEAHLLIF